MRIRFLSFVTFVISINSIMAADMPQPLDTRTRCIVLFRECLVLIVKKDSEQIFLNIVDGHNTYYELNTDPTTLAADLKREREDVDRFFLHNFPKSNVMHQKFDEILFAKLQTDEKPVTVKIVGMAKTTEEQGKLHRLSVKIPDIDERRFSELRFVEVAGKVYWLPFGW